MMLAMPTKQMRNAGNEKGHYEHSDLQTRWAKAFEAYNPIRDAADEAFPVEQEGQA